jgi:ribosomal protein S18 acetylase RimI-like enzyme
MRGKKYAIFVAKEYIGPCQDNDFRASYNVVGMVEMGVTVGPLVAEDEDVESNVKQVILKPRATIGVLCVQTNFQEKGIGKLLVQKCEYVSSQVWNEKRLFAEVEPSNTKALNFFRRNEYQSASSAMNSNDESCLDEMVRNATVARRRKVETRPHIVLEKKLCSKEMNLIS